MDWLKKANAIHCQEERAMHSEWAMDYFDCGMIDEAKKHQLIAKEWHERFLAEMGFIVTATPMATKRE